MLTLQTQAATWHSDSFATGAISTGADGAQSWYVRKYDISSGSSSQISESGTVGFSSNFNYTWNNFTETYQFKLVLGYKVAGVWKPKAFSFSRLSTDASGSGADGTIDSGGAYSQTGSGAGVNPDTGGPTVADKYEKDFTLTNDTDKPITYDIAIEVDDPSGATSRNITLTLQPGESTDVHIEEDHPFEYEAAHLPENAQLTVEGVPVAMVPIVDDTGSGVPVYGTGTGAGGVGTPGNGTPTQSATPNTAAPMAALPAAGTATPSTGTGGVTNDNMNTNASNLGEKIDRVTAQVKATGDQAHKDANAAADKLDKMNKQKGERSEDAEGEEIDEPGDGEGVDGVMEKAQMLYDDAAGLLSALTTPEGGSSSLNFTVSMPAPVGSFNVNLDQHSSWFAIVRGMFLLLAVTYAIFMAIQIIRGALVDQS